MYYSLKMVCLVIDPVGNWISEENNSKQKYDGQTMIWLIVVCFLIYRELIGAEYD